MATDQPTADQPDPAAPEKTGSGEPSRRAAGPRVQRAWGKNNAAPANKQVRATSQRRKKIFVLLACILALLGVIAAWLFFINPYQAPEFVSIALSEYRSPQLPVNGFARRDSAVLLKRFHENQSDAYTSQERNLLEQRLDEVAKHSDKAIVVYLNGFARLHDGVLYFLPADAVVEDRTHGVADDLKSWISMEAILKPLRDSHAVHKLLILDIFHSLDDPLSGIVPDDIAGEFEKLFKAARSEENLLVLCACSAGQTSLVSEELSQSVFGYYLDLGLRGYADGYNRDEKRDGRVSVYELAAFVKARVDRWSRQNRKARQTPVLLGAATDFDLISLESGEAIPKEAEDALPPYPPGLKAGWDLRDQWLSSHTFEAAPDAVHELEGVLLRQEQRWRGHGKTEDIEKQVADRLTDPKAKAESARAVRPAETYSLYLKPPGDLPISPEIDKELRDALGKLGKDAKAEDIGKAKKGFAKIMENLKTKPSVDQFCWTVLQVVLADDTPCTEKVHFLLVADLISTQKPEPELMEAAYIQRVAGFSPEDKTWPVETIRLLFQVLKEGSKAHACQPREFPWVKQLLEAAVDRRLEGEKLLFGGDPDNLKMAGVLLRDAREKYQNINGYLDVFRDAFNTLDEAQRLLPSYPPCLVALKGTREGEDLENKWNQALEESKKLADLLTPTPASKPLSVEQLDERKNDLIRSTSDLQGYLGLDGLRGPLKPVDLKRLAATGPEDEEPAMLRFIRALEDVDSILATPWPSAPQRQELWKIRSLLAESLTKKTRKLDDADNDAEDLTRLPDDIDRKHTGQRGEEKVFRARLSQKLRAFKPLTFHPRKDAQLYWTWLAGYCRKQSQAWADHQAQQRIFQRAAERFLDAAAGNA